MKKCISLFMAIAMICALAIPAFAGAAADPNEQTTNVAGATVAPTIQIEAPSDITLVLNPYKMKYNGDIKSLAEKQDQVMALPGVYTNKTDCDLKVALKFTATPTGLAIIASDGTFTATDKQAKLSVKAGLMADKEGAFSGTAPTAEGFPAAAAAATSVVEYKYTSDTDDTRLAVPATDGKSANYFGFTFEGSATDAPTTAWTSSDKIDVAVVMKPTAVAMTVAAGG